MTASIDPEGWQCTCGWWCAPWIVNCVKCGSARPLEDLTQECSRDADGRWFITYTGKKVYAYNPDPAVIDVRDIAHSLSCQCRFMGHCVTFYSIAQHSALVSDHCPAELQLIGLLHDAPEAYCHDIIRPIKLGLRDYAALEQAWAEAIDDALHLDGMLRKVPDEVLHADNRMLMTERRDLHNTFDIPWGINAEPFADTIQPTDHHGAEAMFISRFDRLVAGQVSPGNAGGWGSR